MIRNIQHTISNILEVFKKHRPLVLLPILGALLALLYSIVHFLTPPRLRPQVKEFKFLEKVKTLKKNRLVGTSLDLLLVAGLVSYSLWHVFGVRGAAVCPVTDGQAGDADATENGTIVIGANTTWTAEAIHEGVIDCTGVDITVNSGVTLTFNMANDGDEDYTEDYGLTLQTDNLTVEGTISANGKGYAGGNGSHYNGYGPGGGVGGATSSYRGGGGGHGGNGGNGTGAGGGLYGNVVLPTSLGSGGGRGENFGLRIGGAGGGTIIITANTVDIDGSITANGSVGDTHAGGGSGGVVSITTSSLSGTGNITANGGNGNSSVSGNGGGGRVFVHTGASSWSGSFSSVPGTGGAAGGLPGTLIQIITSTQELTIPQTQYWVPENSSSFSEWFPEITNVDIINNATLYLYGGNRSTNDSGYGWTLTVNDINIESGSAINMNGLGYMGGNSTQTNGYGPGGGAGSSNGAWRGGGGGYGGSGGNGNVSGGSTYGSETSPTHLGSGGGRGEHFGVSIGGAGGSAIDITTDTLVLNGSITSTGGMGGQHGGGGSGGSILINVNSLEGTGTLNANGGNAIDSSGNGGGGRIALIYGTDTSNLTMTVDPGTGGAAGGEEGTIKLIGKPILTNTYQFQSDNTTPIATGSATPEREINLRMDVSDADTSDTLTPYVELRPIDIPFKGVATHTTDTVNHSGGTIQTTVNISDTASVGTSWSLSNHKYRKKLTIDNSNSSEDLANFPILVKLNSSRVNYDQTQNNGEDIRFTDSSDNPLAYEIEKWNESGDSYVWVNVPSITAGSTTEYIYMYYGNSSVLDGQDVEGVWDSNYLAVWHLNESSGNAIDSTSNNTDLTANGSFTYSQGGFVGDTYYWSGNDYLRRSMSSPGIPVTIEFYANSDSATPRGMFDSAPGTTNVLRNYNSGEVEWHSDSPQVSLGLTASTWTHLAFVYTYDTNRHLSWYKNGAFQATANGSTTSTMGWNNFTLGNINTGSAGWYAGYLDEVRVSSTARTADWIEATHLTSQDSMLTFGETEGASHGQTFTTSKLADNTNYHWQARVCDSYGLCSDWVQFGDNAEGETDFTTQKLVGYWNFDEGYGDTAHDKLGNSNGDLGDSDTICPTAGADCPAWTKNGKVNGALSFDGGDIIDAGSGTAIDAAGKTEWTITTWYKPSTLGAGNNNNQIVSKWSTSQLRYVFGYQNANDNKIWFIVRTGGTGSGGTSHSVVSNTPVDDTNKWYHLAGVYDGNTIKIYIDGKEDNSSAASGAINTGSSLPAVIGAYSDGSQGANAFIDEVKIYSTALTPEEILTEYASGGINFGAGIDEAADITDGAGAPPVAHWDFNKGSGTTLPDISGNGHDGTLGGDGAGTDLPVWTNVTNRPDFAQGLRGKALEFDGDDNVGLGTITYLDSLNEITIEGWIQPNFTSSHPNRHFIFGHERAHIYFNENQDDFSFGVHTSNGLVTLNTTGLTWNQNQWQHIAGVYDGTNQYIYWNGVKIAETPQTGAVNTNINLSYIGARFATADNNWLGNLDDIKVYNYARTPAQIAYDFNRGAPVAWWKMDDNVSGDGTDNIKDSSGNNNHGDSVDGAGTGMDCTADGKRNLGCSFDGTDDYVNVPFNSIFNITSDITLSAWIKRSGLGYGGIISKDDNTTNWDYDLFICGISDCSGGAYVVGMFAEDVNSSNSIYSTRAISDTTTWHHVAFVRNGSTGTFYIDGKHAGSSSFVGTFNTNSFPVKIGTDSTTSEEAFAGSIDNARIYNYALSADQIKKVMNEGSVRFGPAEGSP